MVRQKGGRILISENFVSRLAPNAPSYTNWDVYLISAHGAGDPDIDPPPTVPENTYIVFGGPSGCELGEFTNGIPYESTITVPTHKALIESMLDKGNLGEGNWRPPSQLLKTSKRPINMSKYESLPILERNLNTDEAGVSIYEPRTPYADMKLRFINNPGQTSMLGIYKLPLSRPFVENYKEWKKTNHTYMDYFLKGDSASPSENLGITYTGTTTTLDTLLKDTSIFPPSTKQRIIFVSACRGNYKDPTNRAAIGRLRAMSEAEHISDSTAASSVASSAASSSRRRKRSTRRKTRRRLRN
jgi:hypothetical protein